ncbi:class I SAM-dependent methyltransferase [Amycolatopsis taiwanensis]|uniref:Methyltransferase n=1 Tax=Amycolatopsis taiwanensis TaxID=342230 RepID=A0A9W6VGZ8_9PSEU|nr:class I SAM-dependent methyltransferase [Amycolatopsis taiwanensis]GLY66021.1 methyltransferase [Amycolatopsis taiwanensis]
MITTDGCSVEVYRLLPPDGEAEIVHAAVPSGAEVLDLGCGTGRLAHRLLELGHPVTAVDDSPEMLAHVHGATNVLARIEELRLGRRFDAVLLASHLINNPNSGPLLETVREHLSDTGQAIVQWHPPEWFDSVAEGATGALGEVSVRLSDISRKADLLSATVHYEARGRHWSQSFVARQLSDTRLREVLSGAGLRFDRWCTADRSWFAAVAGEKTGARHS